MLPPMNADPWCARKPTLYWAAGFVSTRNFHVLNQVPVLSLLQNWKADFVKQTKLTHAKMQEASRKNKQLEANPHPSPVLVLARLS